jgi:hypothetical protein
MWKSRALGSAELSVNEARAWAEVGCKQPAPGATQIMLQSSASRRSCKMTAAKFTIILVAYVPA